MIHVSGKRERVLMLFSFALFAAAAVLFLFYWYFSAAVGASRVKRVTSEPELSQILTRTKELRDKWRPWARSHQAALHRLLSAGTGEQQVVPDLLVQLPPIPKGVRDKYAGSDLGPRDIFDGDVSYSRWIDNEFSPKPTDPYGKQAMQKSLEVWDAVKAESFKDFRDVPLLVSVNPGGIHYQLWVSGRITELGPVPPPKPGTPLYVNAPQREVVPPYDFLSSSKSVK